MRTSRGFTLIELMVSVAIFAIVMTISLGALLSISAADKKAESIGSVMSNLNFAVESMTRTIRTGTNYGCGVGPGADCPSGAARIDFIPSSGGLRNAYIFETDKTICGQPSLTTGGCIKRTTDNDVSYQVITAPEVVVTNLVFYLRGSSLVDNAQPNVVITVTGYVRGIGTSTTPFALQTSVTQRLYDR